MSFKQKHDVVNISQVGQRKVIIEITEVKRSFPNRSFVSEVTDIGIEDLYDWQLILIALLHRLKDEGVTIEQIEETLHGSGEAFTIQED